MPEPSHTGGHEQPRHELHREGREKKEERAHLGGRRGHDTAVLGEMGEGARRGSSPRHGLQWRVDDKGATVHGLGGSPRHRRAPVRRLWRGHSGAQKRRGRAASHRARGHAGAPVWPYDGETARP
jgi:hypothetical protein